MFYQHGSDGAVSRRRPAGVGLEHRAADRQGGQRFRHRSTGNPPENLIRPEQFPYKTAVGMEYDSGDFCKSLDEAIKIANYQDLMRRRDERRARGEIVGVGVSTFVEPSGGAGFESGTVRIERTGEITVLPDRARTAKGHETVWAQIAAEMLKTEYGARHRTAWRYLRHRSRAPELLAAAARWSAAALWRPRRSA